LSTKLLTPGCLVYCVLLALTNQPVLDVTAQVDSTLLIAPDSSNLLNPDSTLKDSLSIKTPFGVSDNAIKSKVDYKAKDSIRFDLTTNKVYMYRENDISYEDINLKAGYVEIEFPNNTVYATGTTDTAGNEIEKPVFTMANNSFEAESMKYNYTTKQGLVKKVITEDSEGYLHGTTVKKMPDDVTNVLHGSYTTCEHPDPHFEFRFKKAKVIPENKIVTGPAYFVVEDVPTPLAIPFGMFPNKKGQRSGIVIPTFGESANRGFFFENGGYYFAINDYLDLQVVGDIYTLGSWAVKPAVNYRVRYRFSGYLNANYAINILGEQGTPDYSRNRDFSIRWVHTQDPKARPNTKFSANVNIVSSQYNRFNPVSSNAYLSNTFQSSINYAKSWAGKYFFNASFNHSQNTITREMNLNLPKFSFNVNRFNPFRARKVTGEAKWYENINVNYAMTGENQINTFDTLLFTEPIYPKLRNGIQHTLQVSSGSIRLLKHIVWSNSFNYKERWYTQAHVRSWRNDTLFTDEGPIDGFVGVDTLRGFNAVRDFNFSSSLSTIIYGMFAYKKGPVKAIRHVLRPNLSFSIRPDFSTPNWGYYGHFTNERGETEKYSFYDGFVYGTAPAGRSGNIGFSLNNNLEMKVRNRKDTITGERKIVLIENLSLSTGYDLARDSLNLNRLTITGFTTLFKNMQINYSSSFDPYALDSSGRRINKFEWNVNKRLFRPENHSWRLALTYRLNSDMLTRERESDAGTEQELKDVNENIEGYVDWNVPWSLNLSYNFNYNIRYTYLNGYQNYDVQKDNQIVQTLSFSGDVNITPKWKIGFRSGYDFESRDLTYTSIDIYRDLHCWEMRFNWIPYGFRQSWFFTINIKSSLLQDLKLDKRKDFRDF
jgi:hypothetical protein